IDTLHLTLCSSLEPPLLKVSVKEGIGLAGTVFVAPVCSVVPATLTDVSECPCRPGAGLEGCAPGTFTCSWEARKLGWTHSTLGKNCSPLMGLKRVPASWSAA